MGPSPMHDVGCQPCCCAEWLTGAVRSGAGLPFDPVTGSSGAHMSEIEKPILPPTIPEIRCSMCQSSTKI